jgi:hypothetical protein
VPISKVTEFVVPGKNKTRVLASVVERGDKLTEIKYKVMEKTKNVVKEEKTFTSKKGFSNFRLCRICDKVQRRIKEGYDFLMELAQAQIHKGK